MGWFDSLRNIGKSVLDTAVNIGKKALPVVGNIGKVAGVVAKVAPVAGQLLGANGAGTLNKIADIAGKVSNISDKVSNQGGTLLTKIENLRDQS